MDDASRAELESLRARAYGPDADIDADPAALARLRDLEEAARAGTPATEAVPATEPVPSAGPAGGPGAPRDPFAPVPPVPPRPAPEPDTADPPPADRDDPSAPSAAPHGRRRLVRVLWPVSLVVAVMLTAAVTVALMTGFFTRGLTASQREVAVLQLADRPGQVLFEDTTGDARSALFDGLTVVRSSGVLGSNGGECLVVYQTPANGEDTSTLGGPIFFGCAAGGLPALVQVGVDRNSPPQLRAAFPAGTGLKFQLDGDQVRVIADDSGVRHSAS
ncbi:hypothetical protein LK09_02715 [Microbacterium mangrovi]|uniref:Uncharacterized protein n=1 Tax=Microbacterium mangrovi TaxID=1348253 RepID=A0A0B2AD30_9MICO|nr:hypothetical protein [Microbacterium mangrovi]KHK99551.1 hypothetical protein LK09_02715 [Microbacterium mangrovi]